jgi:hypothetical protein
MNSCDIGGNYIYPDLHGPAVYQPACEKTPTHRWRSAGMVPGHWNYRCAQHVGWLDQSRCTIEPIGGTQ